MPEATPKQEISPNESNATRSEILALIPTLMTVVERICALTRADGAVIAACDHYGLLCLASVGNAPPVDSRLQPESGFTRECLETSRVVLCEDAERDSRIVPSIARVLQLRSALAVPIISEEESLLGVIEVFSSRPSAFGAADIGALKHIAQSLAPYWPAGRLGTKNPRHRVRSIIHAAVHVSVFRRVAGKSAGIHTEPERLPELMCQQLLWLIPQCGTLRGFYKRHES